MCCGSSETEQQYKLLTQPTPTSLTLTSGNGKIAMCGGGRAHKGGVKGTRGAEGCKAASRDKRSKRAHEGSIKRWTRDKRGKAARDQGQRPSAKGQEMCTSAEQGDTGQREWQGYGHAAGKCRMPTRKECQGRRHTPMDEQHSSTQRERSRGEIIASHVERMHVWEGHVCVKRDCDVWR